MGGYAAGKKKNDHVLMASAIIIIIYRKMVDSKKAVPKRLKFNKENVG